MQRRIAMAGAAAAAALAALAVATSQADHRPADKPFAAASKVLRFSPGTRVPLLRTTVRTAKPTDVVFQVSLECSIITDNVIDGSDAPGAQQSSLTEGTVRAWLEVDGAIVPVVSQSSPPQQPAPPGDDTDKVTFCNRTFNRTVQDVEDPEDGFDRSRDYLETRSAASFSWVRLNMGSGVHDVALYADLTDFDTSSSSASAFVGNRTLVGMPGRFANDAAITETGSG